MCAYFSFQNRITPNFNCLLLPCAKGCCVVPRDAVSCQGMLYRGLQHAHTPVDNNLLICSSRWYHKQAHFLSVCTGSLLCLCYFLVCAFTIGQEKEKMLCCIHAAKNGAKTEDNKSNVFQENWALPFASPGRLATASWYIYFKPGTIAGGGAQQKPPQVPLNKKKKPFQGSLPHSSPQVANGFHINACGSTWYIWTRQSWPPLLYTLIWTDNSLILMRWEWGDYEEKSFISLRRYDEAQIVSFMCPSSNERLHQNEQ